MNILAAIREAVARHNKRYVAPPSRLYLGMAADRAFEREIANPVTVAPMARRTYEGMQIFVVADDPEHVAVA